MRWVEAATLDDLPEGSSLEFSSWGKAYVLFRLEGRITCMDGLCPHQGGRLAAGTIVGGRVVCPRRGCLRWSFDVRTGDCPAGESLRRALHLVRVEGRTVLVALPGD